MRTFWQLLWPEIVDVATAKKAALYGVWASGWVVAVNFCLWIWPRTWSDFSEALDISTLDLWVEIVAYSAVAVGLLKQSRTAAVLGLVLNVLDRLAIWISVGKVGSSGFLFVLFFVTSVEALSPTID